MRSRTGTSNGPGSASYSNYSPSAGTTVAIGGSPPSVSSAPSSTSASTAAVMERSNGSGGGGGGGGRSRLHHKRRPGHRRNTQHNVATVEPICDMRKVVNGVVSVDPDKLNKLVQRDPIEMHYAVEEEPFASGLFATVRKCRHRITGVEYAAKYAAKIRYSQDCTNEILHEIALMSLCTTNPRIIHLIDVFDTPTHMILVMEYAPGGDLQTLMDDDMVPYERDAVKFVRQVLEGLLFLHERNMAHLDIKLQNVLLMGTFPDCDVKLCDLEISRIIVAGQEVRELLGTPDYVSPEILHYEPITLSADIWSVGVMAYVLLTGFTPFGGDTDQETFHNICHGQLDFPDELFEDISAQAEDFIRKTLSRDPSTRPTVRECLKHPWLTSWKNVASHQRETISSESQRRSSGIHNGSSDRSGSTLTCPRSAAVAAASSINNGHTSAAAARSLQRALSKSREVLYERVAASNLRKSTSKSRERLCEMRLSISRSRDHLCDLLQPSSAKDRLRNLSKSHEVLSLLSGEQHPSTSLTPTYERQTSLFHILPPAQSLECFSIPPLPEKQIATTEMQSADLMSLTSTSQVSDEGQSLSSALSESTETLCDEKEGSRNLDYELTCGDETPSNSRPSTPSTQGLMSKESSFCDEIANPVVITSTGVVVPCVPSENLPKCSSISESIYSSPTRIETSASLLKRLGRNVPPPLQITSHMETVSPPTVKSPWHWPVGSSGSTDSLKTPVTRSNPFNQLPNSPAPSSASQTIRKLLTCAKEKISPITSPSYTPNISLEKSPVPAEEAGVDNKLPPSSFPLSVSTAMLTESKTSAVSSSGDSVETQSSSGFAVRPRDQAKVGSTSPTSIDTHSMSESQRLLLPSILNRRRASWAYGSKQEDVVGSKSTGGTTAGTTSSATLVRQQGSGKKLEPKLSVSDLITSFNQSQVPGAAIATVTTATGTSSLIKPSSVKKFSVGTLYQHDAGTVTTVPGSSAPSTVITSTAKAQKSFSEKDKTIFKPVTASIQVFQKGPVIPSTITASNSSGTQQRSTEGVPAATSTRPRPHHFSWDIRALPRLPEDVNSPPPEDSGTNNSSLLLSSADSKVPTEALALAANAKESAVKEKTELTKTLAFDTAKDRESSATDSLAGVRSGSVSSDTGCSSSSDLSDKSSSDAEGPEKALALSSLDRRRCDPSRQVTGDNLTVKTVVGEPTAPVGWVGRPRSFSVQADISFLAQPWNRVCTGSVARAFEKFGTKVESDSSTGSSSPSTAPSNVAASSPPLSSGNNTTSHYTQRGRRQSTPGLFK